MNKFTKSSISHSILSLLLIAIVTLISVFIPKATPYAIVSVLPCLFFIFSMWHLTNYSTSYFIFNSYLTAALILLIVCLLAIMDWMFLGYIITPWRYIMAIEAPIMAIFLLLMMCFYVTEADISIYPATE